MYKRRLVRKANTQTMCQTQQNAPGLWTVITRTHAKHTNTAEWWQHGCAAKQRQNNSQRQFWATKRHLIISAENVLATEQCSLDTSYILLPAPAASGSLFSIAYCSLLLLPLAICSRYFPSYSRPYLAPILHYLVGLFTLQIHASHKNWQLHFFQGRSLTTTPTDLRCHANSSASEIRGYHSGDNEQCLLHGSA
jgi:hypothetical protein